MFSRKTFDQLAEISTSWRCLTDCFSPTAKTEMGLSKNLRIKRDKDSGSVCVCVCVENSRFCALASGRARTNPPELSQGNEKICYFAFRQLLLFVSCVLNCVSVAIPDARDSSGRPPAQSNSIYTPSDALSWSHDPLQRSSSHSSNSGSSRCCTQFVFTTVCVKRLNHERARLFGCG